MLLRALPALALLAFASQARAQELRELLAKGPVLSIEVDEKGVFSQATAVIEVDRPPAEVWALVTDFPRYKDFLPKVTKSDTTPVAATAKTPPGVRTVDVNLEIDVPGADPDYVLRYTIDDAKQRMAGQWLKGDLKGTRCSWRLVSDGTRTLVYYTTSSKNFSAFAQAFEDDQQTITVGVNVSAAVATVKAVKRRAESPPAPPAAAR